MFEVSKMFCESLLTKKYLFDQTNPVKFNIAKYYYNLKLFCNVIYLCDGQNNFLQPLLSVT